MSKTVLTALVAVVLLGGAAALYVLEGGGNAADGRGAAVATPDRVATPAAPGERPDASLAAPSAREEALEPDADPAAAPRRAEAEVEAAPPRPGEYVLVVRRGEDGPVVPGALVRWRVADDSIDRRALHDASAADGLVAGSGRSARADDGGRVRIPASAEESTLVVATQEGLWGSRVLGARRAEEAGGTVDLVVSEDDVVRARVVDASGTPVAGAAVELSRERYGRSFPSATVQSGEDGIAVLRHVQKITAVDREASWSLGLGGVLARPVREPLDLERLPDEPVLLVAPATGRVVVRALGLDGEPYLGPGEVELGLVREGEPREISPFDDTERRLVGRPLVEGGAVFPLVAAGPELEVRVTREGSGVPTKTFLPGPPPGGDVVHVVEMGSDHSVLALRAVDGSGKPIADAELGTAVRTVTRHVDGEETAAARTDADGRFQVEVEDDWAEGVERSLRVWVGESSDPELTAELDLSRTLEPGWNDLGDVVLTPPPLFVSGSVVDSAGAPVPRAELRMRRRRNEDATWWSSVSSFRHSTDEEGRFEVRGDRAGAEFELTARTSDGVSRPVRFDVGQKGLLLRIETEGSIVGSFLVDESVESQRVNLVLSRDSTQTNDSRGARRNGQEFRFTGLSPDAYTVKIRLQGDDEPLVEVSGVVVGPGEEVRDPRLQEIDLRGVVRQFGFVLETPPDAPSEISGQLLVRPTGEPEADPQRVWFRHREPVVLTREPVVDVEIQADGYRTALLEEVSGNRRVRLTPEIEARLVLEGGARLPEPPIFVKAAFVDPADGTMDWGGEAFDERREIRVRVPRPGKLALSWIAERRTSTGAMATSADIGRRIELDVRDVAGQVFRVRLDQEEMDRILDRVTR